MSVELTSDHLLANYVTQSPEPFDPRRLALSERVHGHHDDSRLRRDGEHRPRFVHWCNVTTGRTLPMNY